MSWWLDELGHAGDEHLDAEYVAAYDRKAGFDPAEDVDVLKGHGLDDSAPLIDLGAGPVGSRSLSHRSAVESSPSTSHRR